MTARLEEAAQSATEYLASLENLPQEAQHLLAEIKYLDARTEELTEKIATETKHYLHPSRQNARPGISAAVSHMYDEVNALAVEKVALSGRLAELLERAMARLQHDVQRVVELERDERGLPATQDFLASLESTVQQMNGLRAAAAQEIGLPAPPGTRSSSISAPRAQKKRKANASSVINKGKAAGAAAVPPAHPTTSRKSGPSLVALQREKHARSRSTTVPAKRRDGDTSAHQEKENDRASGNSDGEDDGPYCYCGEGAWGAMIACENVDCAREWFHLPCASLKPPLPDVWYCDDCSQDLHVPRTNAPAVSSSAGRKGRKKQ